MVGVGQKFHPPLVGSSSFLSASKFSTKHRRRSKNEELFSLNGRGGETNPRPGKGFAGGKIDFGTGNVLVLFRTFLKANMSKILVNPWHLLRSVPGSILTFLSSSRSHGRRRSKKPSGGRRRGGGSSKELAKVNLGRRRREGRGELHIQHRGGKRGKSLLAPLSPPKPAAHFVCSLFSTPPPTFSSSGRKSQP